MLSRGWNCKVMGTNQGGMLYVCVFLQMIQVKSTPFSSITFMKHNHPGNLTPASFYLQLRWAKLRDSYRRIASESYRRDSNHGHISLQNTERRCVCCAAI